MSASIPLNPERPRRLFALAYAAVRAGAHGQPATRQGCPGAAMLCITARHNCPHEYIMNAAIANAVRPENSGMKYGASNHRNPLWRRLEIYSHRKVVYGASFAQRTLRRKKFVE